MTRPQISVVVPTYGSASSLEELVSRISATLTARGLRYEIVIVNDASPDDSWDVLERLAVERPHLKVIDLQINHGQPRATLCGLAHADGEFVATMDDDLQQPPEELITLLDALEANPDWDAVVGRWPRDQNLVRNFGSWVHAWADRLAYKTPRTWRHTSFRLLRRSVAEALVANETRTPVIGPLLRQVTSRVHNVEVAHDDRPYGRSSFRFLHGVSTVASNFFSASTMPLRLLSALGGVSAALSLVVAIGFLVAWLTGASNPPPGFMSVFLVVTFFGGATLLGLGLLGEYTALMMREVRRPPRWIVRRTISSGRPASVGDDVSRLDQETQRHA